MRLSRTLKLFTAALLSLLAGFLVFSYKEYSPATVIVEMQTSVGGYGQVFWDTGKGYNGSESYRFPIKGTDRLETYTIQLPASYIKSIRLDPMESPGLFQIRSFIIKGNKTEYVWKDEKLQTDLILLQNVIKDGKSTEFTWNATTNDPSVEINKLPKSFNEKSSENRLAPAVFFAIGAFIIILFLTKIEWVKRILERNIGSQTRKRLRSVSEFLVFNLFPLLTALYIFSFWIMTRTWHVDDLELDSSWVYALGKMRSLHLSLGRDAWFTFGPISHWFGPAMGVERYQPLPYYFVGLFVATLFFICLRKIFQKTALALSVKTILFIFFSLSLVSINNLVEAYIVLITLILFTTGYFIERDKSWWIYCLLSLSIIGLLYKFSLGILTTICFLSAVMDAIISRKLVLKHAAYILISYLLLMLSVFALTSGSLNILKYFFLGVEVSSKYSEILSAHFPPIPYVYGFALLYVSGGLIVGKIAASGLPKNSSLSFFVCLLATFFLLFKHGHVRPDSHLINFYGDLSAFFVILVALAVAEYVRAPNLRKFVVLSLSVLISTSVFLYTTTALGKQYKWLSNSIASSWINIGERYNSGFRGRYIKGSLTTSESLRSRHEKLFSLLNSQCKTSMDAGKKTSITFFPWELVFAEVVEGCTWKPFPQLQIYSAGPQSKLAQLDAIFLTSQDRPDIVVLGSRTIDNRNSVSEYTNVLPALYSNYSVSGVTDDYVVLHANDSFRHEASAIVCSENPRDLQGEFLQLKSGPIGYGNDFLWKIGTVLFKAPLLTVSVVAKDRQGSDISFSFRGYLSQLREGVYVSNEPVVRLVQRTFRQSAPLNEEATNQAGANSLSAEQYFSEATAILSRDDGAWNLPVIPQRIPLQVKFCAFKQE